MTIRRQNLKSKKYCKYQSAGFYTRFIVLLLDNIFFDVNPNEKLKLIRIIAFTFSIVQTEQFTVLWILFAIIVLGNTAVLVTLFINKSRKSRMNFFIKHLAIAGN